MPTIDVDTNALLRFTSLFEYGIEKASADFSELLLEAANYLEYLQRTSNEALRRKAELERQLAETEQYLAMAERRADGGPPGWRFLSREERAWNVSKTDNRWAMECDAEYDVKMITDDGTWWHYWVYRGETKITSGMNRIREAIAAAEAAYQEAIND